MQRRVVDPRTGLPSKLKWLPNIPEVHAACEEIAGLQRRTREYEKRSQKQLAERDLPRTTETLDEMWADMDRRGWTPPENRKVVRIETADSAKAKLGLTDAQWNALPDQPESSEYWEGKRIDKV